MLGNRVLLGLLFMLLFTVLAIGAFTIEVSDELKLGCVISIPIFLLGSFVLVAIKSRK
jgi:hypothetical protein